MSGAVMQFGSCGDASGVQCQRQTVIFARSAHHVCSWKGVVFLKHVQPSGATLLGNHGSDVKTTRTVGHKEYHATLPCFTRQTHCNHIMHSSYQDPHNCVTTSEKKAPSSNARIGAGSLFWPWDPLDEHPHVSAVVI